MSRSSIGLTLGAALGKSAAYAVHGAIRAGQATGQFGADVAHGAQTGYADKAASLKAQRELQLAMLAADTAAPAKASAKVKVKAQPVPAAPARGRKVAA